MGLARHYANLEIADPIDEILRDDFTAQRTTISQRVRQKRLTPGQVNELCSYYQSGMKVAEIAAKFGIRRQTVTTHIRRSGIKPRPKNKLNDQQAKTAAKMYASGSTLSELAMKYGADVTTVRKVIANAGVRIRDTKFQPNNV